MTYNFDKIGYWSEIKLDIIDHYASQYSALFARLKKHRFHHVYIDAFAGSGTNISKTTGNYVRGSAKRALDINPPFKEYFFIDMDGDKINELNKLASGRPEVHIFQGDCNKILLQEIFPKVQWGDYQRGLCLLDPYGLDLNWEAIKTAGQMKSIDMILNFPVMDMNRNVLWSNPEGVSATQVSRMNAFWGDDSWRQAAYSKQLDLFGEIREYKQNNDSIATAFQNRLIDQGGFRYIPDPIPMRNTKGSTVYYLFFASQNETANKIATYIFTKYRNKGVV